MSCSLAIRQLQVGYGEKLVLNGIDLKIQPGEMVALLGPSGCGKTTLLNALCGFINCKVGQIQMDGQDITNVPAQHRHMALVFQSYALWPHMSVFDNIAYGLKVKKWSRSRIHEHVEYMLKLVNLPDVSKERVTQLSGGQRQRVALARALAVEPPLLLMDEPLSNLDARVRLNVRHEIKRLQQRLGFTSIIVTHDREEAMVMADRIVVMNHGQIEQIGTPEAIYQQPASAFVADFMGADNKLVYQARELPLRLDKSSSDSVYQAFFRSQHARICTVESLSEHDGLVIPGVIEQSAFQGESYRYGVRCHDQLLHADSVLQFSFGQPVQLFIPTQALHLFEVSG